MGDVHAAGNPHYHLGPEQFRKAARGITQILINKDRDGASIYKKNLAQTLKHIDKVKHKISKLMKNNKKTKLMSYHREFSYFIDEFNLNYAGDIEETPGVPPSAGRIARSALLAKKNRVNVVLASTTNPKKILEKFKEISSVPYEQVATSIRTQGHPSNYEELLLGIAKPIFEGK